MFFPFQIFLFPGTCGVKSNSPLMPCAVDASNSWRNKLYGLCWKGQVWGGDEEKFPCSRCQCKTNHLPRRLLFLLALSGKKDIKLVVMPIRCIMMRTKLLPQALVLFALSVVKGQKNIPTCLSFSIFQFY